MHIGRSALRPLLSKRRDPKELTRHAWANSVGSFCCAHYYDHFGGEPDRCWQCVAEQRPVPFPSPSPPPPLFFLSRKFERGDRLCDRSVDVLLRMILCGRVTVFFFFFYFSRCETASEPSAAWLSRLAGWKTGLRPNELLERLTRRWAFCLSVCGKFISLSSPKPPQPLPCYLFSTLASLGWLVRMH